MRVTMLKKMLLFCSLAFVMVSCDDDDTDYYYIEPSDSAFGVIANASPSSGDLYFHSDENQINGTAINYGDAAGFFKFYTGNRLFSVLNTAGDTLAKTQVSLNEYDIFSAFAVNTFENIELMIFKEPNEYPTAGRALVRFINLSPDAPAVKISASSEGELVQGIGFKEASDFVSLNYGTYDITYTDSETGETLFTDTAVELYSGRIYTVYTKGFVNPPAESNDTFSTEKYWHY